jgi:phosphoglycolate phosphatase-like HAD superfamily hydrolase
MFKTYVFDIDGTLCTTENSDYENSTPIQDRINKVNELYAEGHTILLQTARGMGRSGNSQAYAHEAFYELTKQQISGWGVKHHGLFLGKAAGDIYIDDKGCKDEDFFAN